MLSQPYSFASLARIIKEMRDKRDHPLAEISNSSGRFQISAPWYTAM